MRRLAVFCGGFAAGIFAAQYLLAVDWLLPVGLACIGAGVLTLLLPAPQRKRAVLLPCGRGIGAGVGLAVYPAGQRADGGAGGHPANTDHDADGLPHGDPFRRQGDGAGRGGCRESSSITAIRRFCSFVPGSG